MLVRVDKATNTAYVVWDVAQRRWPKRLAYTLSGFCCLALLAGGFLYFQAWQLANQFSDGPKKAVVAAAVTQLEEEPRAPMPGLSKAETILLIGADRSYRSPGVGNSDTVILVRVDPRRKSVSLLSLPRDLRVSIPGHGTDRINAAYADGGPALLIATVRDFLGVKIDHFVQVSFGGFQSLVSKLSGAYLPIDQRYHHISSGTGINNWSSINLRPGYQKLGGATAMQWVRFRHLDSDFYRVARQQVFLRAVAQQLRARVTEPSETYGILRAAAAATTSDMRSVPHLFRLANTLRQISGPRIARTTIQAHNVVAGGTDYLRANPRQVSAAVRAWADPGAKLLKVRGVRAAAPGSKRTIVKRSALVRDDAARGLLRPYHQLRLCTPTALPSGYRWPRHAAREYSLHGDPAVAAYATAGSGASALWMWTTWSTPPILSQPSRTVTRAGRQYRLYYDSGRVNIVAWKLGQTTVWLTNTLLNSIPNQEMIALAVSCR